jgi:hypothetical protein
MHWRRPNTAVTAVSSASTANTAVTAVSAASTANTAVTAVSAASTAAVNQHFPVTQVL